MSILTVQLPFSAKSPGSTPPPKKSSERGREYLRPSEVEKMIKAVRKVGRHGVRDAAIILLMFRHGFRTAELGGNIGFVQPGATWKFLQLLVFGVSSVANNHKSLKGIPAIDFILLFSIVAIAIFAVTSQKLQYLPLSVHLI